MTQARSSSIFLSLRAAALACFAAAGLSGCGPRDPAQKAEDKLEDAAHEMKQGTERMGEKIEDATEQKKTR